MDITTKEKLVSIAMQEAEKAWETGNSPFGAVLAAADGTIIQIGHNTVKTDNNPLAHAETNVIVQASKKLNTRDLSPYYLVSNAQSCPMCFSGAIKAKITHFIYGCAEDETLEPKITVFDLAKYCKHPVHIDAGILQEECLAQLARARKKMQ
jgi:tRNA(Arg) A34 adenosine deaminase TadA